MELTKGSPRWLSLVAAGLYVLTLDQLTKGLVRSSLHTGEDLQVIGNFSIQKFRNPGIAGGGLAGHAVFMSVLATAAIAALLLFLARVRALARPVLVGFGLVIGGGLGNLVDRVRLGYVTDFILHDNSAFNLADVSILLGTGLILFGVVTTFIRPRVHATS